MKRSEIENVTLRNSADLCKLAEQLGYRGSSSVSSLLSFFDDNPGAMETVAEWVLNNLAEEDDDDDDEEEDVDETGD
jgi:hypothetical protein